MKGPLASFGALFLGAFFSATNAYAQYRNFITGDAGPYWRADIGATIPLDGHITQFGPFSSGQNVEYDVGIGVDAAFGYFFNKYVGAELELGSTWTYLSSVEGASVHDTSFGTVPILANVLLQYPIPQTRVVPYIGGGVGGAATFFDTHGFHRPVPGGTISLYGSDSDFVFAWQGLAGVRFELNSKMYVGLGYRFLHVDSSNYNFDSWYHGGPALDIGFSSHESHMIALTFLMKW